MGKHGYIKGEHLSFVLGEPNHGADIVLGQGAAEAAAATGCDVSRLSVADAVAQVRGDAERDGATGWVSDTSSKFGVRVVSWHREAPPAQRDRSEGRGGSDGGYDGLRNA